MLIYLDFPSIWYSNYRNPIRPSTNLWVWET